jgi:hypothetical protein
MAAGRGFIAASSRASCIRLTTHATSTTKPIPSFGSRRSLPRVRTEILRRRPRANARAAVGRPPALPDAPSAVVRSLVADRCAALSQKAEAGRARRRVAGWEGALATCRPSITECVFYGGHASALPTLRTPAVIASFVASDIRDYPNTAPDIASLIRATSVTRNDAP